MHKPKFCKLIFETYLTTYRNICCLNCIFQSFKIQNWKLKALWNSYYQIWQISKLESFLNHTKHLEIGSDFVFMLVALIPKIFEDSPKAVTYSTRDCYTF